MNYPFLYNIIGCKIWYTKAEAIFYNQELGYILPIIN